MRSPESGSDNNIGIMFGNLKWFFLYMILGVALAFLFPFPFSLFLLFSIVLIIDVIRAKRIIKRAGMSGSLSELFRSISSGKPLNSSELNQSSLKYYCMRCGKENKNVECYYCGSKIKRVGY